MQWFTREQLDISKHSVQLVLSALNGILTTATDVKIDLALRRIRAAHFLALNLANDIVIGRCNRPNRILTAF